MQFYESNAFIYLGLIPVILLIFGWGIRERSRRLSRWGKSDFLEQRLMPGYSPGRKKVAVALLLIAFFFAILALARPQWGEEKKKVERKGVDLIFLLDTSLSMLAEDAKPNRLTKSKIEIKNLVRRLKGDRLGMVAFAGSSFLQCPLTLDYSAFLLFVDALKPGYIPNPGTSLSRAIRLGVRAFPEESRKFRAILIFSDGEDHEGEIDQALGEAKKAGVRIYAIGVGTPEGEPIPLRSGTDQKITGYKKDRSGAVVVTRLNAPLLSRIAKETGGLYLPATAGEKEIDIILKHLESLGERQLKERLIAEREDHFQLFLLLALLVLMGEALLHSSRRGPLGATPVSLILMFLLFSGFMDTPRSLVQKGNRQMEEKKYQSAVENYRKAEIRDPNEPVIRYNLGTSLYQLYDYAEAEKELDQALTQAKDPAAKAKVLYNYGNTQYRLGDFDKAIDSYKKVLAINPKDSDAKYNLEFLQKKKSQFEQKKNQKQNEQNKSQKPNQNDQQQQQPKPDQKQNQQQQQQNQQDQQNQQNEQQQNDQQNQQQRDSQAGGQGKTEQQEPGNAKGENQKQNESQENQEKENKQDSQKENESRTQQEQKQENKQQEQQQGQGQEKDYSNTQGEQQKENAGQSAEQGPPLQGQMSKEDALRILEILKDGEKGLQDLRRPPVSPGSEEVEKDW